jgi:polar amino acid transport system permease protein
VTTLSEEPGPTGLQIVIEEAGPSRPPMVRYWLPMVGVLSFFPTGIVSVVEAARSRRLDREGLYGDAGVAAARSRRWAGYSVVAAITLLILTFISGLLLSNGHAVASDLFDPADVFHTLPTELRGFELNVEIFSIAEVIILAWSLVVAIVRSLPGRAAAPARLVATIYVDVFRGLPSLLVILIVVYGIKRAGLPVISNFSDMWNVILALTLVYGAYVGEVIKGAIESVHWSQAAAARSLGMSYAKTLRYVVLPPAVRSIIPPLLNAFISLQKDTSLVAIIGLLDAVNYSQILALQDANLSAFTGVALCFLAITIPLTRLADVLIKRDRLRIQAGG